MAKYSEQQLSNWTNPPSDTEEEKLENSERMVREAISSDDKLNQMSTDTFGQGSYANNTNVRLNSDIDINIKYTGGFYFDLPENTSREDFGLTNPSSYSYSEFKNDVENALVGKFGRAEVIRKDKCITIPGNSYRVETDVVPTWNYKRYSKNGNYFEGAKFKSDSGKWIVNFPKRHIENGKAKNRNTSRRFKKLTRLHRKLLYKMNDDGIVVSDNITSFLLECLVWNVPNKIMNKNDTWKIRLKESIRYLYRNTKNSESCREWGEVSELLYLFHSGRKWTVQGVNSHMKLLWNHLDF